jgi:hypothetical protein
MRTIQIVRIIAGLIVALLIAGIAITIISSNGAASAPKAESYTGIWTSVDKHFDLEATVTATDITIFWNENGTRSLYWKGSFTNQDPKDNTTIQSKGDIVAMAGSLMASMDDNKLFTYQDGYLTFPLSIMGTGKTIHLEK